MCSGLTHNIDSKYSYLVCAETSRTVSLSNPHLITFNVCVWRTTKAWISLPHLPAHLQYHRGREANFGESCFLSFLLHLPLRWCTCHICPLPGTEVCDMTRKQGASLISYLKIAMMFLTEKKHKLKWLTVWKGHKWSPPGHLCSVRKN